MAKVLHKIDRRNGRREIDAQVLDMIRDQVEDTKELQDYFDHFDETWYSELWHEVEMDEADKADHYDHEDDFHEVAWYYSPLV